MTTTHERLARGRVALLLLALALLASACRSGAEDTTSDTETTEAPATDATSEAPTDAATDATDDATDATTEDASEPAGEIKTDVGVTEEACPEAVNPDNGCIYLGSISDVTEGPFAALGKAIVASQAAFWNKVNEEGGIGGYDVDVATYVRDNKYNPQVHAQVYQEIKPNILAIAQTLGSPTTAAIVDDLTASNIVAAPATWTSAWAFNDLVVESGTNYCFESMNFVDYAVENFQPAKIAAVHLEGDYGNDSAAGVKIAAEAHGLEFLDIVTQTGTENQTGPIDRIVNEKPDVVVITTGPADAATIIGQAVARGYTGKFMGSGPAYSPALLQSPAAAAIQAQYIVGGYWQPFGSDTPAHNAMREALGEVTPNDGYTSGWMWSYPLKAALEKAAENGDLTRAGLAAAVKELTSVDYEGGLPEGAGNYAESPESALRASMINNVVPDAPGLTGLEPVETFYTGPTAEGYELTGACFEQL